MSLDLTDKSTLVQVTAWCCQATCHYLSQCWPRSRRHMASLGPNEFIHWIYKLSKGLLFNAMNIWGLLQYKYAILPVMEIPSWTKLKLTTILSGMMMLWWCYNHLNSTMGVPILIRQCLYTETIASPLTCEQKCPQPGQHWCWRRR